MGIRNAMEEALERGEKIKDQLIQGVMSSHTVHELLQNETVLKSLTKVMTTKDEIEKTLRTNLKSVLKVLNLPSRDEIGVMERKIHRLENEIDGINHKVMSARFAKAESKAHNGKSHNGKSHSASRSSKSSKKSARR